MTRIEAGLGALGHDRRAVRAGLFEPVFELPSAPARCWRGPVVNWLGTMGVTVLIHAARSYIVPRATLSTPDRAGAPARWPKMNRPAAIAEGPELALPERCSLAEGRRRTGVDRVTAQGLGRWSSTATRPPVSRAGRYVGCHHQRGRDRAGRRAGDFLIRCDRPPRARGLRLGYGRGIAVRAARRLEMESRTRHPSPPWPCPAILPRARRQDRGPQCLKLPDTLAPRRRWCDAGRRPAGRCCGGLRRAVVGRREPWRGRTGAVATWTDGLAGHTARATAPNTAVA